MKTLEKKIEHKLSEYIGFDIKKIINKDIDTLHIFGGAIRDIIADKEIHDVDILCLSKSMGKVIPILKSKGYSVHNSLTVKDIQSMYSEIHIIIEPMTFMKVIDGDIRIIQLIRPGRTKYSSSTFQNYNEKNEERTIKNFYYLLGQVDMSNCAVHYSYKFGLKESYFGAIKHCSLGVFEVLSTEMNTSRNKGRKIKLERRGWVDLNTLDSTKKKQLLRIKKLNNILDDGDNELNGLFYMPPPGPDNSKVVKEIDDLNMLF